MSDTPPTPEPVFGGSNADATGAPIAEPQTDEGAAPEPQTVTTEVIEPDAAPDEAPDPSDPAPAGQVEITDIEVDVEDARRPRGYLEADVKRITDRFVTGQLVLPEGAHLTPHHIGLAIKTEDSLEKAPSTGAVNAVLKRWEEIGYALVSTAPYAFTGYTQAAVDEGLVALKGAAKAKKKTARDAAKAAEAASNSAASAA